MHDRTGYGSFFARADSLWFQCRGIRIDFTSEKGLKSGLFGQDMVPEPDIFSFTTQVFCVVELPLRAGRRPIRQPYGLIDRMSAVASSDTPIGPRRRFLWWKKGWESKSLKCWQIAFRAAGASPRRGDAEGLPSLHEGPQLGPLCGSAMPRPTRPVQGPTLKGRIISCSSWARMWQCHM